MFKFENTRTGAQIRVPSKLKGDDWKLIEEDNVVLNELSTQELTRLVNERDDEIEKLQEEVETLEQKLEGKEANDESDPADADKQSDNKEDEYVELDLNEMTNKELDKFAKDEGIELTTKDKKNKDARIEKIAAAFEE